MSDYKDDHLYCTVCRDEVPDPEILGGIYDEGSRCQFIDCAGFYRSADHIRRIDKESK